MQKTNCDSFCSIVSNVVKTILPYDCYLHARNTIYTISMLYIVKKYCGKQTLNIQIINIQLSILHDPLLCPHCPSLPVNKWKTGEPAIIMYILWCEHPLQLATLFCAYSFPQGSLSHRRLYEGKINNKRGIKNK